MSGSQASFPFDPYYAWLGIPPHERPISYYRLLGLTQFESNETTIESAVDQRLAFLRTKALGPHAVFAERLMGEIAQARLVLLDPQRKQTYDAALSKALQSGASRISQGVASGVGSQTSWAAGPVPLEPYNPRRFKPPKKKVSREQWIIAGGVTAGLLLLLGLGIVLYLQKGTTQKKEPAGRSHRQQVAVAPRQPAIPAEAQKGQAIPDRREIIGPQPAARQQPIVARRQNGDGKPPQLSPPEVQEAPAVVPFAAQPQGKPWLDKVKQATVVVEGALGQGSGFFVTMPTGKPVVITNAHVVRDNFGIKIKLVDGRQIPVRQAAVLSEFDLAFLSVEGPNLPSPLELRGDLPQISERVFAYGAPLGLTGTLTEGIVSAIRQTSEIREVVGDDSLDKPVRKAEAHWVQTTAPISPGNSGGPLLDEEGRVVGMNTMGFNNLLGQNLNFALSSVEMARYLATPRFADLPEGDPWLAGIFDRPGQRSQGRQSEVGPSSGLYPFENYQCPDVVLPSGAVFQSGKTRPPERWRSAIASGHVLVCRRGQITVSAADNSHLGLPRTSPFAFYVEYDDNEVMRSAMAFDKGLLHGPSVLFDEKGRPYVIANYHRGTRTGPLVVYDEEQYPALYVDFTRNRKHGLVCVFDQRLPRWIENWKANQQVEACLIKWENNQPQALLQSALTNSDELALTRELMAKVSRYLEEIDTLESELKRGVAEAFRWADNEIKSRRAAEFSAAATAAILARHRAREAAGAAVRAEAQARFKAGF